MVMKLQCESGCGVIFNDLKERMMEEIKIEKLRQIVSRTDKTGNEKVEMLVDFTENYHTEQSQVKNNDICHTVSGSFCACGEPKVKHTCGNCGGKINYS